MKVIGITGGIGSGKSTVSSYLIELGYEVLDADKIAREIVKKGSPLLSKLADIFGSQILVDGELNRKALGKIVFSDGEKRKVLNELTHKEIKNIMKERISQSKEDMIFIDAALLFEANVDEITDENWLIYATEEIRAERAIARDNSTLKEIERVMSYQMAEEEKKKRADKVIENMEGIEELKGKIYKELQFVF